MINAFIAIDVEFESENIIIGNCLQLAFVVFVIPNNNEDLNDKMWIKETFSVCFKKQEGKETDPSVMKFWQGFPEIYKRISDEAVDIVEGIQSLQIWLNNIYRRYNILRYVSDMACVDFSWFKMF